MTDSYFDQSYPPWLLAGASAVSIAEPSIDALSVTVSWSDTGRPECVGAPVEIDWGDGTVDDVGVVGPEHPREASHTYAEAGTYTISVDPLGELCPADTVDVVVPSAAVRSPSTSWTKAEIVEWLVEHDAQLGDDALDQLTKAELLDLVADLLDDEVDES